MYKNNYQNSAVLYQLLTLSWNGFSNFSTNEKLFVTVFKKNVQNFLNMDWIGHTHWHLQTKNFSSKRTSLASFAHSVIKYSQCLDLVQRLQGYDEVNPQHSETTLGNYLQHHFSNIYNQGL